MKDRSNKGLALKLKVAIGILLICVGIVKISMGVYEICTGTDYTNIYSIVELVANILLVAGGVAICYLKKHDTRVVIGLTGIVIGLTDLLSATMAIIVEAFIDKDVPIVIIIINSLVPILDLFLIVFSIRYLLGHRRNAMRMAIVVAIPLIIFVLMILEAIAFYRDNIEYVYMSVWRYLPVAILYGVFLWFLCLPSVREDLSEWKIYDLSVEMYESAKVDPKSTVYRGDLIEFVNQFNDVDKWEDSKDVPDSKECHLTFGRDLHLKTMTFRKMNGSEKIRVSVKSKDAEEYIQGTRFDLREIVPIGSGVDTCKTMRFFGEDGFFVDINVRDDTPVPKKTYAIDRLIDRISFKQETEKK